MNCKYTVTQGIRETHCFKSLIRKLLLCDARYPGTTISHVLTKNDQSEILSLYALSSVSSFHHCFNQKLTSWFGHAKRWITVKHKLLAQFDSTTLGQWSLEFRIDI